MKNVFYIQAIFITGLMLLGSLVQAAHLKGGYVEYTYLGATPGNPGSSQYRITIYQYIDCGSQGGQVDDQIFVGFFNGDNNLLNFSVVVGLSNSRFSSKTTFSCINNPPSVCYRIDAYTTVVNLAHRSGGYVLAVQRCCRIANIINVFNSSGTGITYTATIFTNNIGGSVRINSSPIFAQNDTALVCARNGFEFSFQAIDPDGDSLAYFLTPGLNTPSALAKPNPPLPPPFGDIEYQNGFEAQNPLGNEVSINPTTGVVRGTAPPQAGEFVVAVRVDEYRNGQKIAESRKELHITVGACDIVEARLPALIVNCRDSSVLFENQSTSSGVNSYLWDFGVPATNSDTSTAARPVFVYPDTGVYKATLVVNRELQCPDSAVAEVRIFPGFEANFQVAGVCFQLPYQFTDLTQARYGVLNEWLWDFGIGNTISDQSNLRNPNFQFPLPGVYDVQLISASNKGCRDTILRSVTISDGPELIIPFRDTLICSIDSLQLRAIGLGNFSWTPASFIFNENTATPTVFPTSTTRYKVTLNNSGCVATDSITVNVLDEISVSIGNDTTLCRTDAIDLRAISKGLRYDWQPASLFAGQSGENTRITPLDSITHVSVKASLGKCLAFDTLTIKTVPYPTAFAGNDTTLCFGGTAQLRGTINGSLFAWSPSGDISNPTSLTAAARPTSTRNYILTVRDTLGCPKPVRDTVTVTVRPRIQVNAGRDTSLVLNQPLQLQATTNASAIQWTPGSSLSNPSSLNPILLLTGTNPLASQDFITLTATASTPEGCQSSDDIVVRVFKNINIYVPSGFTPNGDGLNDLLRPTLAGMRELRFFRVYNRYGQLVFETRTPGAGWDGKLNGRLQQTGSFVYQCQAVDFQGILHTAKGNVTLIQ